MKPKAAAIQFKDFKVLESQIKLSEEPINNFDLNLNPSGVIKKAKSEFSLNIDLILVESANQGGGFSINLKTLSSFEYINSTPEELIDSQFCINAPAIVFPYIRSYISALTALSGMPTLTLPTINLQQMGQKFKENIEIID